MKIHLPPAFSPARAERNHLRFLGDKTRFPHRLRQFLFAVVLLPALLTRTVWGEDLKTKNVFLFISDGFRWQEVFNGADAELLAAPANRDTNALKAEFWRATPEERRATLLPFIWGEMGRKGQIFGNQQKGSVVTVSNGRKFSYPGYNEIVTGMADPRIDSNGKTPNPNTNVFEWLAQRPGFSKRIAILGTWDVFPYIFNVDRNHLPIWPAWEPRFKMFEATPAPFVNELLGDTTALWHDLTYDAFLYHAVTSYLKTKRPRVLFVGFGETDEWAHAGKYDQYLWSAHRVDRFIQGLWELAQSLPQYRGKTTFIITADHGRGPGPKDWTSHGEKVDGAEGDWIAILGPDTPALGERTDTKPLVENQMAATIAALLGQDFHAAAPQAGPPIAEVLGAPNLKAK